jgi:hypothetical protein
MEGQPHGRYGSTDGVDEWRSASGQTLARRHPCPITAGDGAAPTNYRLSPLSFAAIRGVAYLPNMFTGASDLVVYSDRALDDERGALNERIDQLQLRLELHRSVFERLSEQLASEQRLLREIEELQDRRPQLRLERLDRELKGRRLQEVAVEVLRRRGGVDAVVHYREWFSMLQAEGFEIGGRNPVNTFLTNVNRSSSVQRVGERSGLYRLA